MRRWPGLLPALCDHSWVGVIVTCPWKAVKQLLIAQPYVSYQSIVVLDSSVVLCMPKCNPR